MAATITCAFLTLFLVHGVSAVALEVEEGSLHRGQRRARGLLFKTETHTEVDTSIIPPERMVVLDPSYLDFEVAKPVLVDLPIFSTTSAQDAGRCEIIKLPYEMNLMPKWGTSWAVHGFWMSPYSGVRLANWTQHFWHFNWHTLFLSGLNGKVAVKILATSEHALLSAYDWKAEQKGYTNSTAVAYTMFMDCEDKLAFVMIEQDSAMEPILIYSNGGTLIATSYMWEKVENVQFVDAVTGYLLATAEAPALNQNWTRSWLPQDETLGNVTPYQLKIEVGGYVNASRLVDEEYRWVLATAIQLRALHLAQVDFYPHVQNIVLGMIALAVVVSSLIFLYVLYVLYRMVYPSEYAYLTKNPFLYIPPKSLLQMK